MTNEDKASALSSQFESVYHRNSSPPAPASPTSSATSTTAQPPAASLSDVDCAPFFVHQTLRRLSCKTSVGPDGLPLVFLKRCAAELALPLSLLFRRCLDQGKIPAGWKHSRVVPVYKKKGDRAEAKSYRPVSLTSAVCRALERHVAFRLNHYLERFHLLSDDQFGYRAHRSTELQLLEATSDWTRALDSGRSIACLYLDMTAAFDTIPHARVMDRLRSLGISGPLLALIQDFLSARTMEVCVGAASSQPVHCVTGVPQGTVLGPLLWNVFYDPIVREVQHAKMLRFADDAKIYIEVESPADCARLQEDVDRVVEWCRRNSIKISAAKTELLLIGKHFHAWSPRLVVDGIPVEPASSVRDLGVHVDSALSFVGQAREMAKKASGVARAIWRAFTNKDPEFYRLCFLSYVRPFLTYASAVHFAFNDSADDKLEAVQRRFTARLYRRCHLPKSHCYDERLQRLSLHSLQVERRACDLALLHSLVFDPEKQVLCDKILRFAGDQDERVSTRKANTHQLRSDACSRATRRKHFANRSISYWNTLPEKLLRLKRPTFKANIIRDLKDQPPAVIRASAQSESVSTQWRWRSSVDPEA